MTDLAFDTLRLKERVTGAPGAPATLATTEPAFNHVDRTLYIGLGDDGNGTAKNVIPIASEAVYQAAANAATQQYVDTAVAALSFLALAGFDVSKVARTDQASAFAVSPTVPDVADGDSSTKAANTKFVSNAVSTAIANLVNGSPAAYDTLQELFTLAQSNADAQAVLQAGQISKLSKDQNLADLVDAAAAWANLGGGTLGKQSADNVNITGGTIGGNVQMSVSELTCGTF